MGGEEPKGQAGAGSTRRGFVGTAVRVNEGQTITLNLSLDAYMALIQLLCMTGESTDDLFRKAISLYKVAVEATQEGKAVGIATSPDVLETQFVGLSRPFHADVSQET